MRFIPFILLIFWFVPGAGQELQSVNYNYQYDPTLPFTFNWNIVRKPDGWEVNYKLEVVDSSQQTSSYGVLWETRGTVREEKGNILQATIRRAGEKMFFPKDSLQQFLIAKVVNAKEKKAWYFYKYLSPNYPIDFSVLANDAPIYKAYVKPPSNLLIESDTGSVVTVFYYRRNFPPAAPPFSEGLSQVSAGMVPDSIFVVENSRVDLKESGLYLLQKDTSSMNGIAFRVEEDYPKFRNIQNLIDPLQYICTRQEYEKLIEANGEKKAFDKVILGITGNKERARNFMRSYFTNVELANEYFTSYKEGWKTDRGMILIIMGLPTSLYKFTDREVWEYKTLVYDMSFTFIRSPTVFDPENYVLIRDKKYQLEWYEIVDLWRKARF